MAAIKPLTQEARDLEDIYNFISIERKKQKIRQKHIAAELGVSQPAVSKMLEEHTLTLEATVTILRMLGKDITECIR